MLTPFLRARRLLRIARVLSRYRLDEILAATRVLRPLRIMKWLAPRDRIRYADTSRGKRLRLALDDLGPIFVKFGQVVSTRRDLLPPDIADELALLQDQVEPFASALARTAIETALGKPIDELFARFDDEPLASASVAQVHGAELTDGSQVVVKVLRPGIRRLIEDDVELIKSIARLAQRYSERARGLRPLEIVAEFERTIYDELDLQREAANASQLRRNFEDDKELYVPSVHWPLTCQTVMVMERVHGIPIDDIDALNAAGVNMRKLAETGMKIFYTQVFRDNFFHADMHPGNIMIDVSNPDDPGYIAIDFGIVGSLPPAHLHYLGENFLAFFNLDYRRVAELHIEAGWIPASVRIDELESAVRTVCEPQLSKPIAEISFAQVLFQLFAVARRFNLIVQPELVLLQKTLLNIEGIGRQVYPDLDVWATAKPILVRIMTDRIGWEGMLRELRDRLPLWMERTPHLPGMIYEAIERTAAGPPKTSPPGSVADELRPAIRRAVQAVLAGALAISAALMFALDGPLISAYPIPAAASAGLALVLGALALRR